MKKQQWVIESVESIHFVAREFIHEMGEDRVFAFYGEMGAGKTTFIRALCEELGVEEGVNSPTFAIVNEYKGATIGFETIYHFDFYRIKNIGEAYDLGYEDYIYSGFLCLIEWSERVEEILPEDCVRVHIAEQEGGKRLLTIS
ncbi:MAG TPA: tRNA (adenosine(37)-N6)-threonylcarbamoyltransferase complex ATPase subunit type 1 TsaE [Porphyromonadaceae bacterium]|nr:tRNA (adenosine(37)-N6)-threonylcarbamoyltransferase complex ATPase subunit type 1 TsaE [Porphyromonadaceae bacterium]